MTDLIAHTGDLPALCRDSDRLEAHVSAATSGSSPLLLIDACACAGDWYAPVRSAIGPASVVPVAPVPSAAALATVVDRLERDGCETIVAVGGGAVLDLARLAAAVRAHKDPALAMAKLTRGRSGFVAFAGSGESVPVIAVPTTLGTGAETSAAACLIVDGRRRLIVGKELRARSAAHHPPVYSTLSRNAIGEAMLEIIMRIAGPFVGSAPDPEVDDRAVRLLTALADQALRWGHGEALDLAWLAACSALTHTPALMAGRAPFGPKLWYVANELADAAGVRKMVAQRLLLRTYLERISAGDVRWGSRERLRLLGQRVAGRADSVAPGGWLEALAGLLMPTRPPAAPELAAAVGRRAFRAWAAGQPMLGGLTARELTEFVAEALG